MSLRKHNYSYNVLCHLEGKEQKKCKKKKKLDRQRVNKCFLFNGTLGVSLFKIDFLLTARLCFLAFTRHSVSDIFKYEVRQRET